jgi:hypothetical protein
MQNSSCLHKETPHRGFLYLAYKCGYNLIDTCSHSNIIHTKHSNYPKTEHYLTIPPPLLMIHAMDLNF